MTSGCCGHDDPADAWSVRRARLSGSSRSGRRGARRRFPAGGQGPRAGAGTAGGTVELQILLSLASEERHGYGIVRDAQERTGEAESWGLGTLYRALRRLVDQKLIEPSSRRPTESDGERRNYYRITTLGRKVVTAEAHRLDALVRAARASGVLGARRA